MYIYLKKQKQKREREREETWKRSIKMNINTPNEWREEMGVHVNVNEDETK